MSHTQTKAVPSLCNSIVR